MKSASAWRTVDVRVSVHRVTGVHVHAYTRLRMHIAVTGSSAALYENFITAGDPRAVANIYDYSRPEGKGDRAVYQR